VARWVKNPSAEAQVTLEAWSPSRCSGLRDLMLLQLWCRSESIRSGQVQSLAWELPYAVGVATKKKKKERMKELYKKIRWGSSLRGSVVNEPD